MILKFKYDKIIMDIFSKYHSKNKVNTNFINLKYK